MRIALTHAFSWPEVRRGAERFMPELAAALARRGHGVVHLTAGWESGASDTGGYRTIRLRRRRRDDFAHERDFGRRVFWPLARHDFDAVHSLGRHDGSASLLAARLHGGRRTVMTDLGLPDPDWWAQFGRVEGRAARRVIRGMDVYSAMSLSAVQLLERCGRSDGVVVPGGVRLDAFEPADRREPRPTILFSGAIDVPRKGVATLLRAIPQIAREEPEVRLWLSGPGDPSGLLADAPAEARARTTHLGLGEPERQHERYGRAWVTALPSTHDSFGMALLESLACGTPIVATTHSAPKELVQTGLTGELCEPEDADALARACVRALDLARRPETTDRCRGSAAPYDWDAGLAPLCEALYAEGVAPPELRFPPALRPAAGGGGAAGKAARASVEA